MKPILIIKLILLIITLSSCWNNKTDEYVIYNNKKDINNQVYYEDDNLSNLQEEDEDIYSDIDISITFWELFNIIGDLNNQEVKEKALELYHINKENIELLSLIWNIYNNEWNFKEWANFFHKANELALWKNGHILFNLWVSYQSIDRDKALEYLKKAKEILWDDENLNNFIDNLSLNNIDNILIDDDIQDLIFKEEELLKILDENYEN